MWVRSHQYLYNASYREIYCYRRGPGGDHYGQRPLVVASGTEVSNIDVGEELYYDKRASYTMLIDGTARTIISERDVVVVLH
jgi:hypothetical protein